MEPILTLFLAITVVTIILSLSITMIIPYDVIQSVPIIKNTSVILMFIGIISLFLFLFSPLFL